MKYNRTKIVIQFMLVTIIATLTIFVSSSRKNITVVVDGKPLKLVTYQKTFDSALKKSDISIDVKDTIDKALSSKIVNNDVITINRAVNLKVFVDNKELNIKSSQKDIALMLNTEKIMLNPNDKVSPPTVTKLSKGMDVTITRVKTETIHETKPIDFKTVIKKDKDTLKSKSKVTQNGVKGEKSITSNITYENGTEVTRKVIKETLVKAPTNKIIVQGTMTAVAYSRGDSSLVSENIVNIKSSSPSSGKTFTVKATAYCPVNGVTTSYTASGLKAVRNPNGISTIAVDPSVIPFGTKLYVEGYGNAIAADKGSAVKGKYIDVFFNTNAEARNWGVKYIKVQIQE
ncbi:3D domain-containing protein [Clostridium sp.]|uniref:3D domain-containing protein n=1 Tax=Clostridium sp. TaxID=1506 RepID=UPI001A417637|nr:3D domain-containing protein [Clostridium sp.]MBK5235179.1 G5 domain-containing protein [Clostridium sp.]